MSSDNTELYYALLEASRNEAEDEYFKARPQFDASIHFRTLFRAGFERAFAHMWPLLPPEGPRMETVPAQTDEKGRPMTYWGGKETFSGFCSAHQSGEDPTCGICYPSANRGESLE